MRHMSVKINLLHVDRNHIWEKCAFWTEWKSSPLWIITGMIFTQSKKHTFLKCGFNQHGVSKSLQTHEIGSFFKKDISLRKKVFWRSKWKVCDTGWLPVIRTSNGRFRLSAKLLLIYRRTPGTREMPTFFWNLNMCSKKIFQGVTL